MFRISKNDDARERDDSADRPPAEETGGSVASSALRWLGGSRRPGRSSDDAAMPAPPDGDDTADELELSVPLDPVEPADIDGDDTDASPKAETETTTAAAAARTPPAPLAATSFLDFDDDDDIDDFDELGDIDGVAPAVPAEKTSFLPDIDLDDLSSSDDIDDPFPLPVDLKATGTSTGAGVPPSRRTADAEDPLRPEPLPALSETLADQPEEDPPRWHGDPDLATPQRLDALLSEGPATPIETGLALQPIPELQTEPTPLKETSSAPEAVFDGHVQDSDDDANDDDDEETLAPDLIYDETDDVDARLSDAGPEIDALDIEALDMEDPADAEDDSIEEDWHAHLADVLGREDDADTEDGAKAEDVPREAPERTIRPTAPSPPAMRRDEPASVLPLSKTLAKLASASQPEEEDSVPVPRLPVRTARQKAVENEPPIKLTADTAGLSHEQLSLGIVANVPRLRRFAAVQIGDELLADRLVQTTIEAVFADTTLLEPDCELGLALMTLLHRRRQHSLKDGSGAERLPETARAFETMLCRGLAGADQFEVHEFAHAINGLAEEDRELLVLVALENLAYDQIAQMLRIPMERVMASVSSARMRLRQTLITDEPGSGGKASAAGTPHPHEVEIHGYLDGELDAHHMADIDALVEYDEDAADRLLHYGIQGDLIRRLYAPLLNRPIPAKMLDALSAAARPARRGFRFGGRRALLAGAVILALGGGVVWPAIQPALNGLVSEAMAISSTTIDR